MFAIGTTYSGKPVYVGENVNVGTFFAFATITTLTTLTTFLILTAFTTLNNLSTFTTAVNIRGSDWLTGYKPAGAIWWPLRPVLSTTANISHELWLLL